MTAPSEAANSQLGRDKLAKLSDAELMKRLGQRRSAGARVQPAVPAGPISGHAKPDDLLEQASARDRLQQALEIVEALSPSSTERRDIAADAAATRLIDIAPRDAIEQMLATQMLALHAAAMDCARRAMLSGQDGSVRREELGLAVKVSRAFAGLADTLDRRRRGGEQKMTVEHVHVHAGGQAIVGNVDGGGRKNGKG